MSIKTCTLETRERPRRQLNDEPTISVKKQLKPFSWPTPQPGGIPCAKVSFDGSCCIYDTLQSFLEEMKMFFENGSDCGDYIDIEFGKMTQEQFNELPEFQGW